MAWLVKWLMKDEDYREGDEIGKGAYGRVIRALRLSDNLPVAIKHLGPFRNFHDMQQFINEIQILACYPHPSILPLYAFKLNAPDNSAGPVIVTSLCPYGSLGTIVNTVWARRPLPDWYSPVRAAIAIYGVARALEFIHSRNIIHRDLKPDNILFGDKLRPYLADFGFARYVQKAQDAPEPLNMTIGIGTPLFMAPELFSDGEYTTAVDIFALAVTIWMVFSDACVAQFDNGTYATTVNDYMRKVGDGFRLVQPPRCPMCWWNVVTAAWVHEPRNRTPAGEIAAALESPEFAIEPDKADEYMQYIREVKEFRPRK
jgi:serine/threonine protein kinase